MVKRQKETSLERIIQKGKNLLLILYHIASKNQKTARMPHGESFSCSIPPLMAHDFWSYGKGIVMCNYENDRGGYNNKRAEVFA